MSALYWPDLDCTPESREIAHPDTVHQHFERELQACHAFIDWRVANPVGTMPPPGQRYQCIRGPRGIVRGVIGDDGQRMWPP